MRYLPIFAALTLTAALGCSPNNPNPTPDQIRQNTAAATAKAASDIKAAAEGVRDGLHQNVAPDTVNINTASRPTLETLPGVNPTVADLIVRHRPYNDPSDLLKKHVLTHAQYDPIAGRLTTN